LYSVAEKGGGIYPLFRGKDTKGNVLFLAVAKGNLFLHISKKEGWTSGVGGGIEEGRGPIAVGETSKKKKKGILELFVVGEKEETGGWFCDRGLKKIDHKTKPPVLDGKKHNPFQNQGS